MKQNNYLLNFLKVTFFALLLIATSPVRAEIKVVTTIKPLHSLIANVMDGVGEPSLIIEGSTSPHSFTLKPSHAKLLEEADLIFWVGEGIETFMEKPLESIVKNAEVVEFMEVDSIEKLKFREESIYGDHDDHDDHDDHEGHAHGEHDPHAWLSPGIAKVWLNVIASKLSEKDPSNASTYFSNASSASKDLDALSDEINDILDPIRDEKFVVFHDAYQYFEKHFNISASGAISLGDASDPSPARVKEIKDRVENEDIHCVLAEPQYKVGLVKAVIEGTHANMAVIDPLGVGLEAGPTLYDKLIRNLATNLSKCF